MNNESQRLREALASVMELIDKGELVRDTSRDDAPNYTLRMLNLVGTLKQAQVALAYQVPKPVVEVRYDEMRDCCWMNGQQFIRVTHEMLHAQPAPEREK